MEIRIHIIHEATREYLRTEAWTPPNEWTALPANATAVEPLPARAGYARVLTLTGDAWEYAEDHRGTSGYTNGEAHTITELGPLPQGWSTTPPPPDYAAMRSCLQAEINSRKNALRDGGFMVGGTLFDSDASARLAYAELAQRLTAEPTFSTEWKASASAWVTMDATLFAKVYAAGAQHIARAFSFQRAEEERLAATPDAGLASFTVAVVPHA